jgi:uncharacterized protein YegL
MSKTAFLNSPNAYAVPTIFLISDGEPTDDYKGGLAKLKGNSWYKDAMRVSLAIGGDDANTENLKEFTGNSETVLKVHTPEALRKFIRFVSVTSAQIGSKSQPLYNNGEVPKKQDELERQLIDFQDENIDINNTPTGGDTW